MRRQNPRLVAALVALLLASIAVGCGGGSSESSDSSDASASGSTSARGGAVEGRQGPKGQAELRECLEEQGFDGEGGPPGGGPPGGNDPDFREALEKCGVDPSQRPGGPGGRGGAPMRESIEGFVACVRENGYDLPDPNTTGDGPVFDPQQVDQNDPAFQEASKKCQDELRPDGPSS
jgi:hypothetical protein